MTQTPPRSVLSSTVSSSARVINWLLLYFYLRTEKKCFYIQMNIYRIYKAPTPSANVCLEFLSNFNTKYLILVFLIF